LVIDPENPEEVVKAAKSLQLDLVVIGPDRPLEKGVVDALSEAGIKAFGPAREAAKIEYSKSFAINLMRSASVPYPDSYVFYSANKAIDFLEKHSLPIVVKMDGLADGKGVWICKTRKETIKRINNCIESRPKEPVIIQKFFEGKEVSVFAFTDGTDISSLVAACDYKKAYDGDKGPNTGGMGSYSWPTFWTDELSQWVATNIMKPTIEELQSWDCPFAGILYAGLIITTEGPKVLEFNARFGDPEAQVILPLLESDLTEIMVACIEGNLGKIPVHWRSDTSCIGIVMASGGYPDPKKYKKYFKISGLGSKFNQPNSLVFHANTKAVVKGGRKYIATAGGRIFTVVGIGKSLLKARHIAYNRIDSIKFKDEFHRSDIALL